MRRIGRVAWSESRNVKRALRDDMRLCSSVETAAPELLFDDDDDVDSDSNSDNLVGIETPHLELLNSGTTTLL